MLSECAFTKGALSMKLIVSRQFEFDGGTVLK
jgi:hypothetical protein